MIRKKGVARYALNLPFSSKGQTVTVMIIKDFVEIVNKVSLRGD
jgi:hypothetical protein